MNTNKGGKLLDLSVSHDFHHGEIDGSVYFIPSRASRLKLNSCQIAVQQKKGVLKLIASDVGRIPDEKLRLDFLIAGSSDDFFQYSELGFFDPGKIIHSITLDGDQGDMAFLDGIGKDHFLLALPLWQQLVPEKNKKLLTFHMKKLSRLNNKGEDLAQLLRQRVEKWQRILDMPHWILNDDAGNNVLSSTAVQCKEKISQLEFGSYRFNGDDSLAFYVPYWGGKKIFSQASIDCRLEHQSFHLQLPSRSSRWRYRFIPKYLQLESNDSLNVSHREKALADRGESTLEFSDIQQLPTDRGLSHYISESVDEIPMRRSPIKGIRLEVNRHHGSREVLCENLPNPAVSAMHLESDELNRFSEVIYYL